MLDPDIVSSVNLSELCGSHGNTSRGGAHSCQDARLVCTRGAHLVHHARRRYRARAEAFYIERTLARAL